MRAVVGRRSAATLLDDAIDRLRSAAPAALLTHGIASLPLFAAALGWFAEVDLRGAARDAPGEHLPLLALLQVPGWGALAAWAAASARGRPIGVGVAWRRTLARFPEVLLAGSVALLGFVLGWFTAGVGFLLVPAGLVGLAAAVNVPALGGRAAIAQGLAACQRDLGRCLGLLLLASGTLVVVAANLLVLPAVLVALGAGGLGIDIGPAVAAFEPTRAVVLAFAALTGGLLVQAVLVVACAELHCEREAEREGLRFAAFADELDARGTGAARERAA